MLKKVLKLPLMNFEIQPTKRNLQAPVNVRYGFDT
jgi:hypothetical protein